MQRIITAVFDNRGALEAAVAALEQAGFSRDAIHLGGGASDAPGDASGNAPAPAGVVANLLDSLFGTDDSEFVQRIEGAVTRGHQVLHLVALQADVERAGAILARHAPVSVETSGRAPAPPPEQMSQLAAEPPGSAHEASWRAHHAATFGGARGADVAPEAAKALAEGAPYPGDEHYDEYAPAYLYGLDMATHEQHGGKEWEEAEPALRSGWEQRHPHSAWSRFKAAVQHGWERLRKEGRPGPG